MMTDDTTQQIVPGELSVRMQIRDAARLYVRDENILPPQTLERLQYHARRCLHEFSLSDCGFEDFCVIMLNNALWETCFARIPKEQRLLLLPFCLRNHDQCKVPRDDLGLICNQCGKCNIPRLSDYADNLGMPVLVAESSSMVAEWVDQGEIQAIIGVSCLDSLRKAYPAMLRHAIPGIAIPLTKADCRDSEFDLSLLNDALALDDNAEPFAAPHTELPGLMQSLFSPGKVEHFLKAATPFLQAFPREVYHALCGHGKHYRPMIVFGIYGVLTNRADFPGFLNPIALAVECFHKASLIHDDIEDGDETRYDEPTLYRRVGIPTALNIGDFLIGEGYRLLGHPSIPAEFRAELFTQAAQAHCELSLGQAQEFEYLGHVSQEIAARSVSDGLNRSLTFPAAVLNEGNYLEQCLETHRLKTAPAFRVALFMGAIAAGKFAEYQATFHEFADLFGVAYQLQDDLEDTADNPASAVDCLMRHNNLPRESARAEIATLYETYRLNAYHVLERIHDPLLKIFMYRLVGKVLKDV